MFPPEIENENRSFLNRSSVDDLKQWLLRGEGLTPVWYNDDRSNVERLVQIYGEVKPKTQKKISIALEKAVSEWNPDLYKAAIINDLALVAAYIKNEGVVKDLVRIIDDKLVLPHEDREEGTEFVTLVSCIIGSSTKDAKEATTRWYKDDSFDWRCTGLLCIGTIFYNPEGAKTAFPKLLNTMDEHPDYFPPGYLASEISTYTGADELEEMLKGFNNKSAKLLLTQMPVVREIISDISERKS